MYLKNNIVEIQNVPKIPLGHCSLNYVKICYLDKPFMSERQPKLTLQYEVKEISYLRDNSRTVNPVDPILSHTFLSLLSQMYYFRGPKVTSSQTGKFMPDLTH